MTNRNTAVSCGLIAVAIALVAVMLSGTVEVVLILALVAGLGACIAVAASRHREGGR